MTTSCHTVLRYELGGDSAVLSARSIQVSLMSCCAPRAQMALREGPPQKKYIGLQMVEPLLVGIDPNARFGPLWPISWAPNGAVWALGPLMSSLSKHAQTTGDMSHGQYALHQLTLDPRCLLMNFRSCASDVDPHDTTAHNLDRLALGKQKPLVNNFLLFADSPGLPDIEPF